MTTVDKSSYAYQNYYENPDRSHRPMYFAKVVKHLNQFKDIVNVLDAGCGGGDFAEGLYKKGFKVHGVDLSESGIRAAQARQIGNFALSSVYDDLLAPFGLPFFDALFSIETIEHLYFPRLFLSRAKDALRPGGLLIITTPYWGYLKNIALALTNRTDKALSVLWDGGHIKHFSRATLTRMVTEQGFEVIAFEGCGEGVRAYTPYLWNGMLMIFRKPL
jgi:2-polyprenyl-3-methyl-5-hydroxy-6-metoxy-1,4-benzoquinol methylase